MYAELTEVQEQLAPVVAELAAIRRRLPNGSMAWRLIDDAHTQVVTAIGDVQSASRFITERREAML